MTSPTQTKRSGTVIPSARSSRRKEAHFKIPNPKSEARNSQSLLTSAATKHWGFPGARNLFRFTARFFGASFIARAASAEWTLKRAEARAPFALVPALWLALIFGFVNCGYAWDYGNGRHGTYILTTNTTIEQLYQTVRLTNDPAQYNPADSNAIPNFQNLIITNGATLTANSWDGISGGRIALKVRATLNVAANSSISVTGEGYRGGGPYQQGESYAGSQLTSTAANYGGGGGACVSGCYVLKSGGGGGYAFVGGNGQGGESGGGTYGTASLDTLFLGSGGGGGGTYAGGGAGGGAILVQAASLLGYGRIQADGQDGGVSSFGGGGGGSGGSIKLLVASAVLGTNNVTSVGGVGRVPYPGGSGGVGRIMIGYAESYTGETTPIAFTLSDTNSDRTLITFQPASQTNAWGSNAVFTVGFTTLSPNFLQWYFANMPIPNATNQTFILTNLVLTNQGNYFVTISNAAMTVVSSNAFLTVLDIRDFDGDGIPNWWELQYGLNPNNPNDATNYPSGEQLTWLQKYLYGLNSTATDFDGDGLTDYDEIYFYHTNPLLADTDGDGIPDGWEVQHGLNPLVNDATQIGSDGVSNLQIYQYDLTHINQLDPRNPFFAPATSIYEVLNNGQHTNHFYYDHEDRLVGAEYSRGISLAYTYDGNSNLKRYTVLSRAGETNGLPVLWQFLNGLTNSANSDPYADSDGDGWSNYQEWLAGTDPNNLQSIPSLLNNPGTNIASLSFPFAPSNCSVNAGQLNGIAGDEIVVGADGNATGKTNSLFILTQGTSSWQLTQLPVGALGITSIAVGQPTNRPSPAIYVGLRQIGGAGAIWELLQTNGLWQTNVLAVSTNEAAYVLGVRSADVLGSFSTNGLNAALYSLCYSNGAWSQTIISTNSSRRGLGTHGAVFSRIIRDSSVRLLDMGGIETVAGIPDYYKDNIQLPSTTLYNPTTGKYHFLTPSPRSWSAAESYFASYHGNLTLPADANENSWIASHYTESFCWIGLYWAHCDANGLGCGNFYPHYADGSFAPGGINTYSGYANWNPYDGSGRLDLLPSPSGVINYMGSGLWGDSSNGDSRDGIGEVLSPVVTFTNQWLIPEPPATSRLSISGLSLATGLPRPNQTNSTSIFYAFADDLNQSGKLDAGDDFTLAEYVVSGNTWTTNTLVQIPITAGNVAQSFSLAAVNFTGTGKDTLFTGEPDGRVYSWTGTDATSPLQRQLFSDAYVGKAWQAMCGVQMPALGKGLVGLMVDPTNQNVCNVIFWLPQAVLATLQPSLIETAPSAAVLPSSNPLGSNAVVSVRLWDNEGNASTPFLQYQILGSTNWQTNTLTALDGFAYNPATRVTALPTGINHTLRWNALADLGANTVTNVLLRARAQDFMLVGEWSSPTPFQINTAVTTNPTNSPVNFTGITPVNGGIQFNWQGSTNAWLYLQRSPALAGTNAAWVNIWTGAPPTLNFGSYTDFFGTNPMGFYRLKIVSP